MDKIDQLFENEINGVIHAYPSVYTKDDVASLLTQLRVNVLGSVIESQLNASVTSISEMDFQEFSSNVTNALERCINNGSIDIYDYSSAEFSIGYNNELSIESIDFNTDAVTDELSNILLDQFQESFGKLLKPEVE